MHSYSNACSNRAGLAELSAVTFTTRGHASAIGFDGGSVATASDHGTVGHATVYNNVIRTANTAAIVGLSSAPHGAAVRGAVVRKVIVARA